MPRVIARTLSRYALLIALIAGLAFFLLYPIGLTVAGGFAADPARGLTLRPESWTLVHIRLALSDPVIRDALRNSFLIATATTCTAIVIALPLATLSACYRFPGKKIFNALILVPLILPPFVGAIGVRALLGREGALNALFGTEFDILGQGKFLGVVAVQSLSLYPIIFLNAAASLANLDPALNESAENLGAGPVRRFFKITLPLIRPGLFAGGTIIFIWSFTELGTPLMFDFYRVTPVQIFYGLKEIESSAEPYALTVILLTCAITFYILGRTVFGRKGHAMYSKAARAADERPLPPIVAALASGLFALVCSLALLPHVGVIFTSLSGVGAWYDSVLPTSYTLHHFAEALGAPEAFGAIRNSLFLSLSAMMLDIVLGILIAYIVVRTKLVGRHLLDTLCMLPLAVPGLVLAFGFVAMTLRWPFGKGGPLEGVFAVLGADPNPFPLLVFAYAVRRLPYIVRAASAGLEQTSGELEEAAINLGASRIMAVRRVIVPLIAANLIAGGLLVFSFSMLEVSDSMILAQKTSHFPITKMIFEYMNRLGDGPYIASAMGVWGMVLLTVTLFGASLMLGKKLGSIFRV